MVINPIVGVCISIIRIPIKGGMTIPNIATFDHGTFDDGEAMLLLLANVLMQALFIGTLGKADDAVGMVVGLARHRFVMFGSYFFYIKLMHNLQNAFIYDLILAWLITCFFFLTCLLLFASNFWHLGSVCRGIGVPKNDGQVTAE